MNKLKYIIIFASITILSIFTFIFANSIDFDIKINGEAFNVPKEMGQIHIKDGRTMVPLRAFTEKLGWNVNWNNDEQSITIPYNDGNIIMKIDQNTYTNEKNEKIDLDVAPYILDDRTYLPLRALTEALGYHLEYDNSSNVHKILIDKLDDSQKSTYTIMLYMDGSDLETSSSAGTDTINEIISASTGDNINILVKTGGSEYWYKDGISPNSNQIHLIKNGKFTTIEANLGLKSMGESSSLSDFIEYATKNYSADKYALIFWSHGFGSIKGIGYDTLFNNDGLTLPEIKQALELTKPNFEFVGFDACLMSTIEVADVFKNYSKYLLASEDFVSAESWEYKSWLNELNKNTNMSAKDLSKVIADNYKAKYKFTEPVLAALDLSQMDNINKQLADLSEEMISVINRWNFEDVLNARYNTFGFGDIGVKNGPLDMVDIISLSRALDEYIYPLNGTEKLTEAIKSAVYPNSPYDDKNINGLSIFFPYKTMIDIDENMAIYKEIGFNDRYMDLLDLYIEKLIEYNKQFVIE